jgi:hypothetical protein
VLRDDIRAFVSIGMSFNTRILLSVFGLAAAGLGTLGIWLISFRVPDGETPVAPFHQTSVDTSLDAAIRATLDHSAASLTALAPDQLAEVMHDSLGSLLRGSFDELIAMLVAAGLEPDAELAEQIRADFARRPPGHRPDALAQMDAASLLGLRTAQSASGWRSFDARTIGIVIVPANPDDGNVISAGDAVRIQHILASGCSGRCVRAEMPYVSRFARELEKNHAASRAYVGVEGTTERGNRAYMVIAYTLLPGVGWVPRHVTAMTLTGEGWFMPRVDAGGEVPTLAA